MAPLGVSTSAIDDGLTEGRTMRNILIAGAAGLFLVLGAGYANADNCDAPYNSPYRTMGAWSSACGDYGYPNAYGPVVEGRSAYVDPDYGVYPYAYPDADDGFYGVGGWEGGRAGSFGHRHFRR
jgi:hypothetical protein